MAAISKRSNSTTVFIILCGIPLETIRRTTNLSWSRKAMSNVTKLASRKKRKSIFAAQVDFVKKGLEATFGSDVEALELDHCFHNRVWNPIGDRSVNHEVFVVPEIHG